MNIITDKREDFIKSAILKHFSFLEDYGYQYQWKKEQSKVFRTSVGMEYISEERKREITINYLEMDEANGVTRWFSGNLIRIPYKDATEDFLALDIYLKSKNKQVESNTFSDFTEENVDEKLSIIAFNLKEYATEIIKGTKWLSGYYPRWDNV